MRQSPLTRALRGTGLSGYEIRCYLSLLERDALTPPEVAKVAGIARPSAYDALEKLMSKGLCISKPGGVKRYSACDPALLQEKLIMELDETAQGKLEDLRKKEEEILERTDAAKQKVTKAIEELKPQYESSRHDANPLEYIEIIKDPYQIHKRFMQLADQAKEEILGFTKPPYTVTKEKLTEQTGQQAHLLRRGLRIRVIYEIPQDKEEFEWWFNDIDANVKYGEEARVIKELPMKMSIFDSRIVLFALEDPISKQPSLTAQVIEHRALAEALKALFQTFWERAEDYHVLQP
jgi:sugar-specific transcriptional regulator TrmB